MNIGDECAHRYSRHQDDAEIQPVPGVPQESELPHAEATGQDLNERLKGVDPCECVPAHTQTTAHRCHSNMTHVYAHLSRVVRFC